MRPGVLLTLPRRLAGLDMVTLEPKQDLDCTSWFAAQLVLDDGDLVAVNLLLAEP